MPETPTALDNISRVLKRLGLSEHLAMENIREEEDRIIVWPRESPDGRTDSFVLEYVVRNQWLPDSGRVALFNHGTSITYREPNANPALQICVHRSPVAQVGYFFEIDLDFYSPSNGITGALGHTLEVLRNKLTRKKTNQEKMSQMLDKRFGHGDS